MTLSNVTTNDSQDLAGLEPGGAVRRSVLPGGVRLLTEHVSGVRSAAIGAWLPVGSRDEAGGHFGSTHFLEHLLFKGTARRGPLDIAEAFDKVGGEANAATAKESTCYYARVIDQDVPMAVDVLLDMVTGATLEPTAFETERGVILEELAMAGDDPQDVANEAFAQLVYGDSPLARPIGGTPDTIRAVPRDAVWEHYRQHYRPDRLVVTAAGNIDHDALAGLVTAALKRGGWDLDPAARPVPRRPTEPLVAPPAQGGERTLVKPVEQAQVIIGCAGLRAMDPRRHVLAVLSAVLGGGMSSRLFQEIRERRGLAYSTYSFGGGHADAGSFGLYAGCGPDVAGQVAGLMEAEWERMADSGITAEELARAKGQLSGGLVLGLEDTFSRMSRLGNAEITAGELPSLDELLRRIDAVTARQVKDLAGELAGRPRSRFLLTPRG